MLRVYWMCPRRVRDDELAPWRGEVAVGHVDGDALFAFRAQAVREQGQVHFAGTTLGACLLHSLHLVLEDLLGVVQQTADQRAFAVVYAACRGEPQQVHVQISRGFVLHLLVFLMFLKKCSAVKA
jgi:hypothetical protein